MNKKILLILLAILLISGILVGGAFALNGKYLNVETFYEGITIEGISLEGLTKEEAFEFVKNTKEEEISRTKIELYYDDYFYELNLKDLNYTYNYQEAVDEAFEIGRDGNFINRYKTVRELEENPINIKLEYKYDRNILEDIVKQIEEDIEMEAIDARISIEKGNINITDEVYGRSLDKNRLLKLIEDNLENSETIESIEIPVELSGAKLTKEYLSQINGVIGRYTTSFNTSSPGRIHNIELSSKALDNLLLMPGEEISFNEKTGPREKSNGYKEAPVIVSGEYVDGTGGGVCQTSTTLYNALLYADVTIVERSPHSIAPAYVPRGRDGAVAMGYKDLKFKNTFDFPIYIKAEIVDKSLEFSIYGDTKAKDYIVEIEPVLVDTIAYKVHEQIDNNAEPGSKTLIQEGRTGYKVRTYKSIIKDGEVIERKEISFDYYPVRDYIYKVGPKPSTQKPEQPKKEEAPNQEEDPDGEQEDIDEVDDED